jgi:formylglycine-generating enzyme required for sulfatase activity
MWPAAAAEALATALGALVLSSACGLIPEEPPGERALATKGLLAEAAASPGRGPLPSAPSVRAPAPAAQGSSPAASAFQPGGVKACPAEAVQVEDFCIDRYEAHLVRRIRDGSLVPHPPEQRPSDWDNVVARSAKGVLPQAYISRIEAARACENAGKRLCSLREWYRACRGQRNTVYPYGARYESRRCNVGKPHLLSLLAGANPRAWSYERDFNNPELSKKPGFLARTGEYEGCASDHGVHDQVGNLHEWVSDRVDASLDGKLPLEPPIRRALARSTGKGVFMGGFYSTQQEHGEGCNFVTTAHEPAYHDYSTGFRCCRSID